MPVIRIEIPEGVSVEKKRRIREGAKQAVLDTLAPKETRYDYVAVREVFGEIGDGVPLVTVDLRPGREPERKKALADALATLLKTELGVEPGDVYVLYRENPAGNHYCGGQPLAPWEPASELADEHQNAKANSPGEDL